MSVTARLNNILKRFGEGWALFFEAERIPANAYPGARFADPLSWLIDEERRAAFQTEEAHHESCYYLTFVYLPPPETASRIERVLYDRAEPASSDTDAAAQLASFETETSRALDMLAAILPEAVALSDAETLTYLHGTISGRRHPVAVPAIPTYLDAILCDTPLLGGIEPKLGDDHLRVLTVLGFPNTTTPGVLDALNDLGFAYRWTTRWIALDKTKANKLLTSVRRQWFSKRKSVGAVLREVMFDRETALVDPDADNKALDADEALQELGSDEVAFGYMTTTIIDADADPRRANEKLMAVERIVNGRGFTTIRETLNAVDAWLGSLPGQAYANVRQPIVHTLNLAHLMPVSAVWAGPRSNRHLNAPPLMLTQTRGATPFRLDLHIGDVGHTLIVGPTGAGKSVLLALLALQFRRYIGAQVIVFDRGNSARAAVLAMTGASIELGLEGTLSLQPLARIDEPGEIAFALDWVTGLLVNEGLNVTLEIKTAVWTALQSLASAPKAERTLTGLAVLVQSSAISAALAPYTLEGAYGRLLDGAAETLKSADVLHVEFAPLMAHRALVPPVLTYLFHRLEARFDGRPSLLVLDEAWTFLDHPLFAARIREWLKTLRKKNVAVVFATQSLADIERSAIAPSLIESCMTRIFLPNDRALEPQARDVYRRFGLNDRQIEILATASPKRDYYAQTARGNRLFELGLGPIALAVCGASSPDDLRLIDQIASSHPPAQFAGAFLQARGLPWAADLLSAFPGHPLLAAVAPPAPVASPADRPMPGPRARQPSVAPPMPKPVAAPPPSAPIVDALLSERFSPYRIGTSNRAARRRATKNAKNGLAGLVVGLAAVLASPRPGAALTVFDPLNYQENVLSAVRALEQINNQIRQLEAQAQTIARLDQNLQPLQGTIAPDLKATLATLQGQIAQGEGLALGLAQTQANFARLYPKEVSATLTGDDIVRNATVRWNEAYASLQRSAVLQGQIGDATATDSRLLDEAMSRSHSATGALDVAQAGNELNALGVKQVLQLQGLIAANARAETTQRARDLMSETEARQRFKGFLGTSPAYTKGGP